MAVLKINFVILLVIVILSHTGFSPDKEDIAEKGTSKRKHVEVGESSVKRRNIEVDQSDSIDETPPVVEPEEVKDIYEDQKLCLEQIRQVFRGKSYEEHIIQAMNELTVDSNILNLYAEKYYRSLEGFLQSSLIMSVDMFCDVEGLGAECVVFLGAEFGRATSLTVKRIFGCYTPKMVQELNNPLLSKYYNHVLSRYEINTKKSTSPEKFCENFHKLPEGVPALDWDKVVVDTRLSL